MGISNSVIQKVTLAAAIVAVASSVFFVGCSSCNNKKNAADVDAIDNDSNKTTVLSIGGEIISIPSPIQTAFLINKVGATYDKDMINPTTNSVNYSTKFHKSLNLGVYGADLGYVTMYDKTQEALGYLNTVRKLGDDLGVSSAFSPELIKRFQANFGKKDSMLRLVSVAYRQSDNYLKNNMQNDVSGLILTGGWIESMHFVTSVYKTKPNADVKRRIGEQKSTIESIIKLLSPYSDQKECADLVEKMKDLEGAFKGVEFKYTFQKPTTDPDKQLTIINSTSEVTISDDQIKNITEKIAAIRTLISTSGK